MRALEIAQPSITRHCNELGGSLSARKEMKQARVAFVSMMEGYPWGGSEELWSQAAGLLAKEGFHVGVNVKHWSEDPAPIQTLERLKCEVVRRSPRSVLQRILGRILQESEYAWLERFRPDLVVISQGGNAEGLEWMEACLKRGIPYVTITHAVADHWWPDDQDGVRLGQGYTGAKTCLFVSQRNLEVIQGQLALRLPNAKVIRSPVCVANDACPTWPDGPTYRLACVGRLDPKAKGQDVLFRVLLLEKWRKRPIRVTLYGSGVNAKTLARLKEFWNLGMVEFAGFLSNPEDIWTAEHILVLPSRVEGLPLTAIEAMLCGRPCIVTDVAGNTEVVEDNVTGFVAAAPTPALLDEAMERAWDRRHDWQSMGQAAARRIRELIPRDPVGEFLKNIHQVLAE